MFVVAAKLDAAQDAKRLDSLRRMAARRNMPFFKISSVTGEGIEALKFAMAEAVLSPR